MQKQDEQKWQLYLGSQVLCANNIVQCLLRPTKLIFKETIQDRARIYAKAHNWSAKNIKHFSFFKSAIPGNKELVLAIRRIMKASWLYHRNTESVKKHKRDGKRLTNIENMIIAGLMGLCPWVICRMMPCPENSQWPHLCRHHFNPIYVLEVLCHASTAVHDKLKYSICCAEPQKGCRII